MVCQPVTQSLKPGTRNYARHYRHPDVLRDRPAQNTLRQGQVHCAEMNDLARGVVVQRVTITVRPAGL